MEILVIFLTMEKLEENDINIYIKVLLCQSIYLLIVVTAYMLQIISCRCNIFKFNKCNK